MFASAFTFGFLLSSVVLAQDTSLSTVTAAFNSANIPSDTDIMFQPTRLLEVSFPQSAGSPIAVTAGNKVAQKSTASPPTFAIQGPSSGLARRQSPTQSFVINMIDLDAPFPQLPTEAEFRHFLGANFQLQAPNAQGLSLLTNSTPALSEYVQPSPPPGSDPHRYVFFIFNQPANFNDQTVVGLSPSLSNFNISQFALDNGLGNPIGGTFMLVGPAIRI